MRLRSLTISAFLCLDLASGLTAGLTGCASTPVAAAPEGPGPMVPRADELAGISWGTTRAQLERRFPGSQSEGDQVSWMGTYTGRAAYITFHFGPADELEMIVVDFQSSYASMDACGVDWRAVRGDMNRFHGPSQSDNLAAYWTTQTSGGTPEGLPTAIELSCDPGTAADASLGARFSRPTAD